MDDTKGFYKYIDENLLYANRAVSSGHYDLVVDLRFTYSYPIDGWYWFDSIEEARIFFNIPEITEEEE